MPYERISLHKVLGIIKSEQGFAVLLGDIYKGPIIRQSAISVLKHYNDPQVLAIFVELLGKPLSIEEKIDMLDYVGRNGGEKEIPVVLNIIRDNIDENGNAVDYHLVAKCMNVLRLVGKSSEEVFNFFRNTALDRGLEADIRSLAIIGLSSFKNIPLFEELLKDDNEAIYGSVYRSIALLCNNLMREMESSRTEEEQMFTYTPEKEDKVILEIRVLLGKMTVHFESFPNRVKAEYINAMLSSNHRELIIYAMKALTSNDSVLIERTLYLLYANVDRLRDPDKLFRNLISLSMDTDRQNKLIVEIFESYFSGLTENRKNILLKDKIFNYIIVTLETFFETYRKEFMVTSVIEKDFPENFQRIRHYVLERLTPELKNRIVYYLQHEDTTNIHKLLGGIAEKVPFMQSGDTEDFTLLVEVLYDDDEKSREISASRIDTVNFEKRYLRNRIVRLCELIGRLKINNAATILVKIFNYVKKYQDEDIFNATAHCLSVLNYSYMLGELELLLATGDHDDHMKGVRLLSQFSDQRSLTILIEYLRERAGESSEVIKSILRILLRRDIGANIGAQQIFHSIIEENNDQYIRSAAVLCLGRCSFESDMEYLNEVFFNVSDNQTKEAVVQAIGHIISTVTSFNKRHAVGFLQEYLKDPGIKVRIYSCALLIQLGHRDAFKTVRDMMIIKNKSIQRGILSILGGQRSTELGYFLISLLKEDYGISHDIVSILKMLPEEELREIDQFVVNIFKKYESPESDLLEKKRSLQLSDDDKPIKNLDDINATMLIVEIAGYKSMVQSVNMSELSIIADLVSTGILAEITDNKGIINSIADGVIVAYYEDATLAAQTAMCMLEKLVQDNQMRRIGQKVSLRLMISSGKMKILNQEFVFLPEETISVLSRSYLYNRIIIDGVTAPHVVENYYSEPLPDHVFREAFQGQEYREIISSVNYLSNAESVLNTFIKRVQEKRMRQVELDEELKKRRTVYKSPTAIAYAQAIDEVGRKLKNDFSDVATYLERRVTDREMVTNVNKMLNDSYKRFIMEISKIIVE
jgi:HEAT repeat protein